MGPLAAVPSPPPATQDIIAGVSPQNYNNRAVVTTEPTRKLAVLLHADVVGSTALVQLDEILAHQRMLETFRRFSEVITSYGGIVHEVRGDALVAEFPKASDAVAAAVDFQTANTIHNEALPDDVRPAIRVGVAMGEVVVADSTVTGEGIVLAQRLEKLANPGGVCIQDAAYQTVPKRLPFNYKDLGERSLKGFSEPIKAYTVTRREGGDVAVTPDQRTQLSRLTDLTDRSSIAVLPFTNMSGDPEQDYFSDGVAEDIITGLSHFRRLSVVARNSSFVFKGRSVDVAEVAEELGVRYVVEGSVRKVGNRVRVTAQLVESESRKHVWAQRYDRHLDDIFDVQDEITRIVVATVAGQVDATEVQRATAKRPDDMSAYDLLLRGMHEFKPYQRTSGYPSTVSRDFFQQAIEHDPQFARAYAHKAYSIFFDVFFLSLERDHLEDALELAEKAVSLDPRDSFSEAVLGLVLYMLGNVERGIALVERSLQQNPNDAEILHILGFALADIGRASEGVEYVREAIRLSPLNRYWDHSLGCCLAAAGQYTEALQLLRKYADTEWKWSLAWLAATYACVGELDEAQRIASRSAALQKSYLIERGEDVPENTISIILEGHKKQYPGASKFHDFLREGLQKVKLN